MMKYLVAFTFLGSGLRLQCAHTMHISSSVCFAEGVLRADTNQKNGSTKINSLSHLFMLQKRKKLLLISLYRRAGTDQIAVAHGLINT
jgi:hypothetical protein